MGIEVVLIGSYASLPSEDYWKSVLPNTPMPRALKHLLQPSVGFFHCSGCLKDDHQYYYWYALSEVPTSPLGQQRTNLNVTFFFLEKDLHLGKRMNLDFPKSANEAKFLPRRVADSIPFSSKMLPKILNKLSVDPSSDEAVVIGKAIKLCENTSLIGEDKLCTTSLESMVDYSTSKLGRHVEVISTDVRTGQIKEYTVVGVKRMPRGKAMVACHKLEYPYGVFYCHKTSKTVVYKVSMVAADGLKAETVAVCHQDTAAWNPKHLAFLVLKVKPGAIPICHFLYDDGIVWAHKS